jgi:hypothetical protein
MKFAFSLHRSEKSSKKKSKGSKNRLLVKYIKCPLIWTVMRVSSVPSIAENQTNGEWKAEGAIPQVKKNLPRQIPQEDLGFFHFCFLRRGLFTGVLNHNPRRS